MCICDAEAVGDSDARGGRTLRGKQAQGTGKWSFCKCVCVMWYV